MAWDESEAHHSQTKGVRAMLLVQVRCPVSPLNPNRNLNPNLAAWFGRDAGSKIKIKIKRKKHRPADISHTTPEISVDTSRVAS